MKVFSYLRVSTQQQNTEKFKYEVLQFCNEKGLSNVEFIEEVVSGKKHWKDRLIFDVVNNLDSGDMLVVPELTRLGRSTLEVLDILKILKEKGVSVYSIKERLDLCGDDIQSKVMVTMISLFAEIERDFISMRVKEALTVRKKSGVKLGRPKGPGKSKLDEHRERIKELLSLGLQKSKIAQMYNVHRLTLHNWMEKNQIK